MDIAFFLYSFLSRINVFFILFMSELFCIIKVNSKTLLIDKQLDILKLVQILNFLRSVD